MKKKSAVQLILGKIILNRKTREAFPFAVIREQFRRFENIKEDSVFMYEEFCRSVAKIARIPCSATNFRPIPESHKPRPAPLETRKY